MAATVHILHPQNPPVSGFLRIGHTGQKLLERLHAEGRLKHRRFVFDAAHVDQQLDLLKLCRANGFEVVLDPNFAEMAALGRYQSAVSRLPWAKASGPWTAADFARGSNVNPARAIAEFAVAHGVDAVLAPTHLLGESASQWLDIDHRLCEDLRRELDRCGGREIAVDYQLLISNALLKDPTARQRMIASIGNLPIENLWMRVAGFGATATGTGTRNYIESVRAFHSLGLPVVADQVGGLAGLASTAFGATAAISHGVAQKETFSTSSWKREESGGGGGSGVRVYIPELDRYLSEPQLNAVLTAKGGRSKFCCNDSSCCRHGLEDMLENSQNHFLSQRFRQLEDISSVPETRRAEHFLLRHIDPAVRAARQGAKLKIEDAKTLEAVANAKTRLVRFRDAMADLLTRDENVSRSRVPNFRGGGSGVSAVLGR